MEHKQQVVIAPLDVIGTRVVARQVLVEESTTHLRPSVLNLVAIFGTVLQHLISWATGAHRSMFVPKPLRSIQAIVDVDTYPLPPVVEQSALVVSAASSSNSLAVLPAARPISQRRALAQMDDIIGVTKIIDVGKLGGVKMDTLEAIAADGLVTSEPDASGGTQVAVQAANVTFGSLVVLTNPAHAFRSHQSGTLRSKCKASLIMQLHEAGLSTADASAAAASRGQPRLYLADLKRPQPYFACLLCADEVFDKQVASIEHGRTDMYYKCLLGLPTERLAGVLAIMAGKSDDWFKVQLTSAVAPSALALLALEDDVVGGGGEIVQVARGDAPQLDLPSILPPPVELSEWGRCTVDLCGLGCKVYLDNCT